MNKLIGLALIVASAVIANPSLAATKKKPASAAKPAVAASSAWAQMPAGQQHKLRKVIAIRGADAASWETKALVTIAKPITPGKCKWDQHTPPDVKGAKLFVQSDSTNHPRLYLMLADPGKPPIVRDLSYGGSSADSSWLVSKVTGDWSYFVLFEDTNPSQAVGKPIDKRYRIEIFPPDGVSDDICKPERPDQAITVAATSATTRAQPCQPAGGSGAN
jgi:hypothetical protein